HGSTRFYRGVEARPGHRRRRRHWKLEQRGEVEGAAAALLALHPEPAAHHLHQSGRDGESQAGAAIFPGGGAFSLAEGFENALLLFYRDPYSCVGDAEMSQAVALSFLSEF